MMKKISNWSVVLLFLCLSSNLAFAQKTGLGHQLGAKYLPPNQALTVEKLLGTWKSKVLNTNEVFYFCIYPDSRAYVYGEGWERWEKYKISETSYCAFDEKTGQALFCSYVSSFDGKTWEYKFPDQGSVYSAEKISNKQIIVPKKGTKQQGGPNALIDCSVCNGSGVCETSGNVNSACLSESEKTWYHTSGAAYVRCCSCNGRGEYNSDGSKLPFKCPDKYMICPICRGAGKTEAYPGSNTPCLTDLESSEMMAFDKKFIRCCTCSGLGRVSSK